MVQRAARRRHLGPSTVTARPTEDYIYGPTGQPVEQINLGTSTPTYLTYNPSDSSWVATNTTGVQTGFWRYDAYGNLAYGTPSSPFGYSGQCLEAATGFVNDRARWHQPQVGDFTTRDPLFSQTDAAYTYAEEDPVNRSDPSGETDNANGLHCGWWSWQTWGPYCDFRLSDNVVNGLAWFFSLGALSGAASWTWWLWKATGDIARTGAVLRGMALSALSIWSALVVVDAEVVVWTMYYLAHRYHRGVFIRMSVPVPWFTRISHQ
jgi:RHS repeat-associated protein